MGIKLFGYNVFSGTLSDLVGRLLAARDQSSLHHVVTLNSEMVVLAERNLIIKKWLTKADTIVADGYGIRAAINVLGKGNVNIITGVRLMIQLLQQKGMSFYFVGSTEDIVTQTVYNVKKQYPDIDVVGSSSGFFSEFDVPCIIDSILKAKPDVILLGMGFPKQEYFIQTLSQYYQAGIAIGVGGGFDILAGSKKLAPQWINTIGCEWIYRTFQDPKRILRWKYLFYYIIFTLQHMFSFEKE